MKPGRRAKPGGGHRPLVRPAPNPGKLAGGLRVGPYMVLTVAGLETEGLNRTIKKNEFQRKVMRNRHKIRPDKDVWFGLPATRLACRRP